MNNVIATMCICNNASLNIYKINSFDETVLAGINDMKPRTYKLYYTNKGAYFNYGTRTYLNEFIRINY